MKYFYVALKKTLSAKNLVKNFGREKHYLKNTLGNRVPMYSLKILQNKNSFDLHSYWVK